MQINTYHVGLRDHGVHLAKGAVGLGEADRLGQLHRGGARPQPDLDLDIGPLERLAEVLSLRGALAPPANHANLLDASERLGQNREEVAAALDHLRRAGRGGGRRGATSADFPGWNSVATQQQRLHP